MKLSIHHLLFKGLKENIDVAKRGGTIAKHTRNDLEKELGESIVSSNNNLDYDYITQKEIVLNTQKN